MAFTLAIGLVAIFVSNFVVSAWCISLTTRWGRPGILEQQSGLFLEPYATGSKQRRLATLVWRCQWVQQRELSSIIPNRQHNHPRWFLLFADPIPVPQWRAGDIWQLFHGLRTTNYHPEAWLSAWLWINVKHED